MSDLSWRHRGHCVGEDPEMWMREKRSDKNRDERAKAICKHCPVIKECHQYAETHTVYGIWAGVSYGLKRLTQAKLSGGL